MRKGITEKWLDRHKRRHHNKNGKVQMRNGSGLRTLRAIAKRLGAKLDLG